VDELLDMPDTLKRLKRRAQSISNTPSRCPGAFFSRNIRCWKI